MSPRTRCYPARHVYRFRAEQVGTFWYHTHQVSSKEVRRGLFGALVIEPRGEPTSDVDETVVAHTFDGIPTLNGSDRVEELAIEPGATVRLRLLNSDSTPHRLGLLGTPFVVAAIDGTVDLNEPSQVEGTAIQIAGGGRVDLAFTMPRTPARLAWLDTEVGVALNGGLGRVFEPPDEEFDPLTYGKPAPAPFDASSSFDRQFDFTITRKPGFHDGDPGLQWAINGGIHPDVPVFVVEQGDLVEITITNDTKGIHPMHLHGHHVLVLSRGVPVSREPVVVRHARRPPGERYVVGFRADNPGLWMDHCHNLRHAADGLDDGTSYAGVTTPFLVGGAHHNTPE